MAKAVFCIATSEYQAEAIVNELKIAGFVEDDISVLLADKAGVFSGDLKSRTPGVGEGALGWLTGLGQLDVPGAGSFVACGPIMSAVTGAGPGGIGAALMGMGFSEVQARRYEKKTREGDILISARSENPDQSNRATAIFKQAEAQDVAITAELELLHPQPPEVRDDKWEKW